MLLRPPTDYVLARDVCSYGYFLLDPNDWDPATRTFRTTIDLDGKAATVRVTQPATHSLQTRRRFGRADRHPHAAAYGSVKSSAGRPLAIRTDVPLSARQRAQLKAALVRTLRLDDHAAMLGEFHRLDKRFRAFGRGRLMRSPTLFEDIIKTVTSCNVTWPSTITMNRRLCEVHGRVSAGGLHAFPTAERLARVRPASLRARCSVGYRDARIIELARMFVSGEIDTAWYENPGTTDEAVREALLELPGVGPYAAANIMQLLGRYAHLPLDTESVRHGRTVLGFKGTSARIMKRIDRHFKPMGAHKFRSYWFELWDFYERKRGPAWTWQRETTGKSFTASKLSDTDWAALPTEFTEPSRRGATK